MHPPAEDSSRLDKSTRRAALEYFADENRGGTAYNLAAISVFCNILLFFIFLNKKRHQSTVLEILSFSETEDGAPESTARIYASLAARRLFNLVKANKKMTVN